jgi:hypothetical protein
MDTAEKSQSSRHIPCAVHKVVGTFHVPSTWNPGKRLTANGTAERACTFSRLRHGGACLHLFLAKERRSVPAPFVGRVLMPLAGSSVGYSPRISASKQFLLAKIEDLKNLLKLPMTKSRWFLQYRD